MNYRSKQGVRSLGSLGPQQKLEKVTVSYRRGGSWEVRTVNQNIGLIFQRVREKKKSRQIKRCRYNRNRVRVQQNLMCNGTLTRGTQVGERLRRDDETRHYLLVSTPYLFRTSSPSVVVTKFLRLCIVFRTGYSSKRLMVVNKWVQR